MKRILCLLIAILTFVFCQAGNSKKTIVWNEPAVEENIYIDEIVGGLLDIYKVELNDTETKVYMHIVHRSGYWVKFVKETYLSADGKRYIVKSCEGLELDEYYYPINGKADVVFHFAPLPKDTKKFDFIEGDVEGAFKIFGVQDKAASASNLFPSLWRNEVSGDWEIGFYDDFAIYDCRYWQYKQKSQKGDKYSFVLTDGKSDLVVHIGKNKEGKRTMSFGDKQDAVNGYKEAEYSLITSVTLPDYPQKDTVTSFKDNHYQKLDTVTLVGWLKDMPEYFKQKGNTYSVLTTNLFERYEGQVWSAEMDSLGRFTVKIPMYNASTVLHDTKHILVETLLEPGETYFLLYDFKRGHKMFMGKNCRLQNEILAHPTALVATYLSEEQIGKISADEYMNMQNVGYENAQRQLSELILQHPTLSERYRLYCDGYYKCSLAEALRQGTYDIKDWELSPKYTEQFVQLWQENKCPYTFYREFHWVTQDIIRTKASSMYSVSDGARHYYFHHLLYPRLLKSHQLAGDIKITDAEINLVEEWSKVYQKYLEEMVQEPDTLKTKRIDDDYSKSKIRKEADIILKRKDIAQMIKEESRLMPFYEMIDAVDSFHCSPEFREIIIAQQLVKEMKNSSFPLNDIALKYLDAHVSMEPARQYVLAMHEKLLAIQNKDISKSTSLKAATSDMANMTDGEKLLRKIVEPYKGKIVLIDIWGTWCSPCKDALSHSKEEYKCLAPYDVVYLYLANRSSEDGWKNVIKLYDLVGDNIVHYNLPEAQQNAIENYLKVNSYPSYRLLDRNGDLLDIHVDARNLTGLEQIIKNL